MRPRIHLVRHRYHRRSAPLRLPLNLGRGRIRILPLPIYRRRRNNPDNMEGLLYPTPPLALPCF